MCNGSLAICLNIRLVLQTCFCFLSKSCITYVSSVRHCCDSNPPNLCLCMKYDSAAKWPQASYSSAYASELTPRYRASCSGGCIRRNQSNVSTV